MVVDITRGDTNVLVFTITEAYDANGNPLTSLAGYTATLQARYTPNDATPVFSKSGTINGMTVTVRINPADTASLQGGERLVADLELADGSGNKATVRGDDGPFILYVVPDVTR
ncbi:MAG: hypothetical protein KatS3mg023_3884 [Armatimonadota bacterium]|nr:MAG: hypothetical protein KatS3mg023_3884 [Armatimonadota bacterium]